MECPPSRQEDYIYFSYLFSTHHTDCVLIEIEIVWFSLELLLAYDFMLACSMLLAVPTVTERSWEMVSTDVSSEEDSALTVSKKAKIEPKKEGVKVSPKKTKQATLMKFFTK